jgi:hypothetical protein
MSEIGFIAEFLNKIFIGSHSLPPLWFTVSVLQVVSEPVMGLD